MGPGVSGTGAGALNDLAEFLDERTIRSGCQGTGRRHQRNKSFRGVPSEDGVSGAIWTQRVSAAELDETIAHTAHMFQAEIDKASDLRITVVGDRVFASAITAPDDPLDWRSADWSTLTYDPFEVPASLADLLRAYLDYFGLVFGCFDFALERGSERPVFIECNPNGQWGFLPDSELIADAFAALLQAG